MALARLNVPGVMLYGGSIAPGRYKGAGRHDPGRLRGDRQARRRHDDRRGARRARARRQPRRRRLRRPVHRQHDGDGLRGPRHQPDGLGDGPRRPREQGRGRGRGRQARHGRPRARPAPARHHHEGRARERDRRDRDAAAARRTACCTCSPSPARPASSSTSTTSTASPRRTPLLCDLKPGGKYVANDLYAAGGVPLVAQRLLEAGLLHEDAITVTGRTVGEHAREAVETEGQQVVRPLDDPIKATGGLAILRGNLAPEGCVVKLSGHERRLPQGPGARLRERGGGDGRRRRRDDRAGRRHRHPQRGPRRRPRHARDARRSPRRSTASAWASTSRCSPTGASAAPRTASWPATSRPSPSAAGRSPPSTTATSITIDVDARRLDVELDADTIAQRVAALRRPRPHRARRRARQVREARLERLGGRGHVDAPPRRGRAAASPTRAATIRRSVTRCAARTPPSRC